jgi:hypothetical protein
MGKYVVAGGSNSPSSPRIGAESLESAAPAEPLPKAGILPHLEEFFDRNHDGKIGLGETYDGLRRLDFGRLTSVATALAINFGLAALGRTSPFGLSLEKMSHTKHPGDTGAIDTRGGFHEERIEQLFAKYARRYGDALTATELLELAVSDLLHDLHWLTLPRDAVAVLGKWGLLFKAGAEERDGQLVLTKQRVLDFYLDDRLFDRLALENQHKREVREQTLVGRAENAFHTWIF